MDLNFNKVTYDGELSDFSEDELRETVREFETAQESNVAEFEKAAEGTDDVDESTIEDFETARNGLIEDISEAEAFDAVPLTEEQLEEQNFSQLQEWDEFVAEEATDDTDETPDEGGDGEGDFDDMGQKSPKDTDDETEKFVEEELGKMQGLNL